MKKLNSLIVLLTLPIMLSAAGTFQKAYGGREEDLAKAVIVTDDGYTFIGQTGSHREKRADMYVVHMDKKGNKLWSKAIGGRDDEEGNAIIATKTGYIAVGTTESFGSDRSSMYVVALDKTGDAQWQRAYFSRDDSYYYGTGIATSPTGFKVVGWENKLEFFDADVFGYVVDIDKDGERLHTRRYGGDDDNMLYDVLKTSDGNYLLVGTTESFRDDYGFDGWAVMVDAKGKVLWQKIYGWGYDESFYAVAPAKEGGFIMAGITKSNRDKRDEVYVVRIDKHGKPLWQNTYGGRYDDEAFDIVADKDGYVITGLTESNTHGREDLYLLKIDDKGRVLWDRNYGGKYSDVGYGVAKTADGYIVVGETESYGNGRKDAYVLKVNKKGLLH